jgi:hypothetical protein
MAHIAGPATPEGGLEREPADDSMPFLVRTGSLTVVVQSPSEANRVRDELLSDDTPDVIITDMSGSPVDIDRLLEAIREIDAHRTVD